MGPIGIQELILIIIILILVFGASRLPAIGKGLGEAINNFKSSMKEANKKDAAEQQQQQQKTLGNSASEKER